MKEFYTCNEVGIGIAHNCAGVKYVQGRQVCGSVQQQIDYCGHIFCARIGEKIEIDEDQLSLFGG